MGLFRPSPLFTSDESVVYENDSLRLELPSNWPVADEERVLHIRPPDGGIMTARVYEVSEVSQEQIRDAILTPMVESSGIRAAGPPRQIAQHNWQGWCQEGAKPFLGGLLGRDCLLIVIAYAAPKLVHLIAGARKSRMIRLRPYFDRAITSLEIRVQVVEP